MKTLKIIMVLVIGIFYLFAPTGCRKISGDTSTKTGMDALLIPQNFSWETSRVVRITISSNVTGSAIGSLQKISIFDGNPLQGGALLITGSTGYQLSFESTLRVPTALKVLFAEIQSESGFSQIVSLEVSDDIAYTFNEPGIIKNSDEIEEPTCTSGCDVTSTSGTARTISDGMVWCMTGNINTGAATFKITNGTARICGSFIGKINLDPIAGGTANMIFTNGAPGSINTLTMKGNSTLTIYSTCNVTVSATPSITQNARVINYGTLSITGTPFAPNDLIQNMGTLTINGEYLMNGTSGSLVNSGTLAVTGNWNVANPVTNTGIIVVSGAINFNGSTVENDCRIVGQQQVVFNTVTYSSIAGYLKGTNQITVNAGATLTLISQSMMVSPTINIMETINGQGSFSVLKATQQAAITGTKKLNGPLELLTPSGTLTTGSFPANFSNGAVLYAIANATAYIPITTCNPDGSGQPPPPDSDGDGVADNLDDYPADPARAYDNWYPGKNNWGSLAFEDLWPSKGDYDMNDMIVDYQFRVVSNAQNKIVDILPLFYIRAVGASLHNGFGWQFDNILPGAVSSVTRTYANLPPEPWTYISLDANGTENGQEKAVIIVFENTENVINRVGGTFYNTEKNGFYGLSDTIRVAVHFQIPQLQADLGTPPYNPFIIKNLDRGVEIHLPNYVPTSLADLTYLGTTDDASNPALGIYYRTATNLPWAINLPVRFDYTWEYVQILYGHLKFGSWAESGGATFPDWYNNLAGYRDTTKIYATPAK